MSIHRLFFYSFILSLPTQLGRHFWLDWSYVWGLRVDYLAPTVYLSDILLGLALTIWLIGVIRENRGNWSGKKIKRRYGFLVLALVFALVLQFSRVPYPKLYLYKFVKLVELVLLGGYVAKTTKTKADFKRIINLLLIGAVFESGLAIAQFIKQSSVGGLFWWLGERTFNITTPGIAKISIRNPLTYSQTLLLRPYGTFSHPNSLAGYLLIVLILTFLNPKSKILPLSIMLVASLLTFSRSAWLVGLIILVFYLISKASAKLKKSRLTPILLILILYTLYSILYTTTDPESLAKRWNLIDASWEMIKSSPFFGIGLGHFIPKLVEFPQKSFIFWLQPVHNIFLLVTAETGLVGLGIFLGVLGITYKRLVSSIKYKQSLISGENKVLSIKRKKSIKNWSPITGRRSLVASLTAILLLGLADHYWLTLQQNQLLFALVLGLCWARLNHKS